MSFLCFIIDPDLIIKIKIIIFINYFKLKIGTELNNEIKVEDYFSNKFFYSFMKTS